MWGGGCGGRRAVAQYVLVFAPPPPPPPDLDPISNMMSTISSFVKSIFGADCLR